MSEQEKVAFDNSLVESNQSSAKSDDNLLDVSTFESEVVDDDTKSLKFGKSLMDDQEVAWMVTNRMLEKSSILLPKGETTPDSKPHECVVFQRSV
jgi:hypothetical protein